MSTKRGTSSSPSPTSSPSSRPIFTFTDLNVDSLFEVFKYLPLRERVRLERTCKNWGLVLGKLWSSQRRLSIGTWEDVNPCPHSSHRFSEGDVLSPLDERHVHRILALSPNLAAIYWEMKRNDRDLGANLAKWCPRLEHVYFNKIWALKSFAPFATRLNRTEPSSNQIKCVLCVPSIGVNVDLRAYDSLIEQCPHLQQLLVYKSGTDLSLYPNVKYLLVSDYLTLKEQQPDLKTIDLSPFPNLQLLEIICDAESFGRMKGIPENLREIVLTTKTEKGVIDKELPHFFRVFQQIGRNLKAFTLWGAEFAGPLFQLMPLFCHNMERVVIYCGDGDACLDSLAQLRKLRSLTLRGVNVTDREIVHLLEGCPKLRELDLIDCLGFTPEILVDLTRFADRHPKRVFKFKVNHSFIGKKEKKPSVRVKQNLRIYYFA